jgi:hypothetical protein
MRTINSEQLHTPVELQMGEQLRFGELDVTTTELCIELSDEHRQQMSDAIQAGLLHFNGETDIPEETLAQKITGLPTMLARIDCSIVDGTVQPFEIEERPNGIGITTALGGSALQLNQLVRQHFMTLIGEVPQVIAPTERIGRIDDTFTDVTVLEARHQTQRAVLLRTEPSQVTDEHDNLVSQSVSTARSEGSKGYRERTGHARRVSSIDQLGDEADSMVVKGLQCSKAQHIDIVLSSEDRATFGKKGTVTRSRALRNAQEAIDRDGAVIVERFIPPISARLGDMHGNMILRVFAAVSSADDIRVLGGVHVTRPELVVHGARNALHGLVLV